MSRDEINPEGQPNAPKPEENEKPSTEERRINLNINELRSPDWSRKPPLQEGYRPSEDKTNPMPPSDSASSGSEE